MCLDPGPLFPGCRSWWWEQRTAAMMKNQNWSSTEWTGVQNGHKPYLCVKREYCAVPLLKINRKGSKAFLRGSTIRCMTQYTRPYKLTPTEAWRRINNNLFFHRSSQIQMLEMSAMCLCASYYTTCQKKPHPVQPVCIVSFGLIWLSSKHFSKIDVTCHFCFLKVMTSKAQH